MGRSRVGFLEHSILGWVLKGTLMVRRALSAVGGRAGEEDENTGQDRGHWGSWETEDSQVPHQPTGPWGPCMEVCLHWNC